VIRAIVILAMLAFALPAHADPPWAKGVSEKDQDKANALFAEGNQLFTQLAHAPALEKYKAAIALWDHPMIRFNMAVTLVRLERMLDAADQLEHALRYGDKPFTKELYQQALDYQNLISRQLGHVEVTSKQDGTAIMLDGKPWFVAPGSKAIRVEAGEHVIVAERKGYMTESRRVVVAGGKTVKESISLMPLERAVIIEYKHPRWIPWTVTAVGGAVALGGLGMWLWGDKQLDDFTRQFVRECPTGCEADLGMHRALAEAQDSALLKGKIGVSMMVAGGAVTVSGLVWGLWNRPIRRVPKVEVAPTAGGVAASTTWRF
jgi:hypothetical protein